MSYSQEGTITEIWKDNIDILRDIEIGKVGTRMLHADIARPQTPPAGPMPAVVWIHGGGWSSGSHHDMQQAVRLAGHGYLVLSVEYRLVDEAMWPAQIEDCKLVVRWLREHAASYHVNPDRIGCWGASAGGHLAALRTRGQTVDWNSSWAHDSRAFAVLRWSWLLSQMLEHGLAPLTVPVCTPATIHLSGRVVSLRSRQPKV